MSVCQHVSVGGWVGGWMGGCVCVFSRARVSVTRQRATSTMQEQHLRLQSQAVGAKVDAMTTLPFP